MPVTKTIWTMGVVLLVVCGCDRWVEFRPVCSGQPSVDCQVSTECLDIRWQPITVFAPSPPPLLHNVLVTNRCGEVARVDGSTAKSEARVHKGSCERRCVVERGATQSAFIRWDDLSEADLFEDLDACVLGLSVRVGGEESVSLVMEYVRVDSVSKDSGMVHSR